MYFLTSLPLPILLEPLSLPLNFSTYICKLLSQPTSPLCHIQYPIIRKTNLWSWIHHLSDHPFQVVRLAPQFSVSLCSRHPWTSLHHWVCKWTNKEREKTSLDHRVWGAKNALKEHQWSHLYKRWHCCVQFHVWLSLKSKKYFYSYLKSRQNPVFKSSKSLGGNESEDMPGWSWLAWSKSSPPPPSSFLSKKSPHHNFYTNHPVAMRVRASPGWFPHQLSWARTSCTI